jgi:Kef-type K+ transport system membrane component KefB
MDASTNILLTLGILLLLGLSCHELGRRTHIPRVSLLLLVGTLASPKVFNLVPAEVHGLFPYVNQIALCMVGFLLGEQFIYRSLFQSGKLIWSTTLIQALFTAASVFFVLTMLKVPLVLALLLAGISPSTAPAATVDIIREGNFKGRLPTALLKIVAIDDALGIIMFALFLALAQMVNGADSIGYKLFDAIKEVGGAIVIGCALGWPMAKLTGRLSKGEPTLIEALGFVLLCGGLAQLFNVSYLLAAIAMGAMVANFANHHERPFHEIEGISTPLLIIFFMIAGFHFDPQALLAIGGIGIAYIASRSFGKVLGGYLGAKCGGADRLFTNAIGWCLLPQAGIALGLALMAAQTLPNYATKLLSLLVSTTMVFELLGPLATRFALNKAKAET